MTSYSIPKARPRWCSMSVAGLLVLVSWCLAVRPAWAEQTLADADWAERELGAGVVWRHYLFSDLYGSPQSVSYIEADLTNPNVSVHIPYLAAARQKTSTMVPAQVPNAVAGINGSYFATSGPGGHTTYLRISGTEIPAGGDLFASWGRDSGIAVSGSGAVDIIKRPAGGWSNASQPTILACGPLILYAGSVPSNDLTAVGSHCTARHPRSAAGVTADNRLILLTVDGRTDMSAGVTCEELGMIMDELGCVRAFNLDGGGSTTLWGAGEPYDGVLNYPSDNGAFDHLGERACSNAIAIASSAPTPALWDARLTDKIFSGFMESGSTQSVSLVYKNIGTGTWTAADTRLVLARPESRTSPLYHAATWPSPDQPAVMTPATVGPGETATFTFILQAPELATSAVYDEHFMLTRTGVGRFGPADSEAWMRIGVQAPVLPGEDFIVESRVGGLNAGWYSDSGMADTATNCTAPGCTPGIGMRWGSTYRSVAGNKHATVAPDFPEDAFYNVYVAWGAGSNRRDRVTYHVNQPGQTTTFLIDQTATANEWVRLGTAPWFFEKGYSGSVVMTNENIDESGSMYAGAVKFEYVPSDEPDRTYEVQGLSPAAARPVIDGQISPGEWDAASPASSGFVRHDNPAIPATEDGSFRMLFDETDLYILFQMPNAYLPGYTPPAGMSYGYADLGADKINFFLTPGGVNRQKFYRLVFSPNPTDGVCYVWSQASLVKTTNANVGTDWAQRGGAAWSYEDGLLTIEYRIAWSAFNYPGIEAATWPEDGAVWGVQPCISNQVSAGVSESVNWEPDSTPSYVLGEPFGRLQFNRPTSGIEDWSLY